MGDRRRIAVRELRNNVSEVLRRVEAGETLEVTVSNRPVAVLSRREARPRTMAADQFLGRMRPADAVLGVQLALELTETTDDIADPWSQ